MFPGKSRTQIGSPGRLSNAPEGILPTRCGCLGIFSAAKNQMPRHLRPPRAEEIPCGQLQGRADSGLIPQLAVESGSGFGISHWTESGDLRQRVLPVFASAGFHSADDRQRRPRDEP